MENQKNKTRLIRTATVAVSLDVLLKGQLSFLNQKYEVIAVSGADTHLENVRDREGVQVISVNMKRQISLFHDLKSLIRLYILFKKTKPTIVHSITPKAGLLSMCAAYLAKVPIRVHTFTGLIFPSKTGFKKKILILMDKLLCKFATHIYPEGKGVLNDLVNHRITSKPLKVIANGNVNGIDTTYFNPENITKENCELLKLELGIQKEDIVFVFVGRLVADKGINELIEAFKKISTQQKQVKLLLVGTQEFDLDPLKAETLLEIKNNKNIISVGFQADVRPYFAISTVLVFPSYREGFPNVVLQAGAMELPSIVTDINGSNEIILEGVNGLIIPVKNQEAIYQSMLKLIEDVDFKNTLKLKARQLIIERYEQDIVWKAILAEYNLMEKNVQKNNKTHI